MPNGSRHWKSAGAWVAAPLLVAVVGVTAPRIASAVPAVATPNAVLQWNLYASTAIVDTADQNPGPAGISFAMVQGAVYDAVNGITRTHQPYLVQVDARPGDSQDAAAATAAYRVLANLFPEQRAELGSKYAASLGAIPAGPAKRGGIADGEQAAAAMLRARSDDGRNGNLTWVIGTEPGQWRPTPPRLNSSSDTWVGQVKPFVVPSTQLLRTPGPQALSSRAYAADFNEVKSVGALVSATRTPDQTEAAFFHNAQTDQFDDVMQVLALSHGLNPSETARMFAMTHLAVADAFIGCWKEKYRWSSWRPITAIREAADDGNSLTAADPLWKPLLFDQQGGFPEHPSGHACETAAAMAALGGFFGTDKIPFSAYSENTGTTRSYPSFSSFAKEVNNARVWGGVHFRTADNQGSALGVVVAVYLRLHYFHPVAGG